jgi:hypothetical protein
VHFLIFGKPDFQEAPWIHANIGMKLVKDLKRTSQEGIFWHAAYSHLLFIALEEKYWLSSWFWGVYIILPGLLVATSKQKRITKAMDHWPYFTTPIPMGIEISTCRCPHPLLFSFEGNPVAVKMFWTF